MPTLSSFSTPAEIRNLANEEVNKAPISRAYIAEELDVNRATVTKALGDEYEPSRYLNLNRRILSEIFDYEIGETAHYQTSKPDSNDEPDESKTQKWPAA